MKEMPEDKRKCTLSEGECGAPEKENGKPKNKHDKPRRRKPRFRLVLVLIILLVLAALVLAALYFLDGGLFPSFDGRGENAVEAMADAQVKEDEPPEAPAVSMEPQQNADETSTQFIITVGKSIVVGGTQVTIEELRSLLLEKFDPEMQTLIIKDDQSIKADYDAVKSLIEELHLEYNEY